MYFSKPALQDEKPRHSQYNAVKSSKTEPANGRLLPGRIPTWDTGSHLHSTGISLWSTESLTQSILAHGGQYQ